MPNISIGKEELDALLEGINYAPKESEGVKHDVKFNKDKDFDLTSNLHTADNFSNNLIKKEGIDIGSDNVSLENMELNNNNDPNEKLESFVDNKQHLDLIDKNDKNGNIEHENGVNCTVFKSSSEPLELKEF